MKRRMLRGCVTTMIGLLMCAAQTAAADGIWDYDTVYDETGNIICEFEELAITLPADWEGRYVINDAHDGKYDGVYFCSQKVQDEFAASGMNAEDTGLLFFLVSSEDYEFVEDGMPYRAILGSSDERVYYMIGVQGAPYDTCSGEAETQWHDLADDIDWVVEQAVITSAGGGVVDMDQVFTGNKGNSDALAGAGSSQYILADSSDGYLEAGDLAGLNANELQMAINEIYARHNRRFVMKEIQDYFESKSWYSGTVPADKFDPSVLNQYENTNIALMLKCMNGLGNQTDGTGSTGNTDHTGNADHADNTGSTGSAVTGQTMYATSGVNIRSKASTGSAVMGIVPQGGSVTVTGPASNGWVPVSCNGIQGYISQEFLSTDGKTAGAPEEGGTESWQAAEQTSEDAVSQEQNWRYLWTPDDYGTTVVYESADGSWADSEGREFIALGDGQWSREADGSIWSENSPEDTSTDSAEIIDEYGNNPDTLYLDGNSGIWHNMVGGVYTLNDDGTFTGPDGTIWYQP